MPFHLHQFTRRGPDAIDEQRVRFLDLPLAEIGLIALYVVFAAGWSRVSSSFLDWLEADPIDSPALQTLHGLNFLLITGLLLYAVLRRSYRVRRRAQAASRLSQLRFESVAEATTDAIWDWDLQNNVVWWSDSTQRIFGYSRSDISPAIDWWLDRLHPVDKERVVDSIDTVINSDGQAWTGHYRFRRRDGSYAEVLDRVHVIRDMSGHAIRVVGGLSDVTAQRRAEEALERSRRELRALSAGLESAREEERTRISREIHDELGQVLTATRLNLDWIERQLNDRDADPALRAVLERVVESNHTVESAITTVQRIATDLRPVALDTLGLASALQQEVERFQKRTGLDVRLDVPAGPLELPRAVSTTLYRALQETLTNVARHAQAQEVRITLRADAEHVVLSVEDDGRGIDPETAGSPRSLGLVGMRERAGVLGGELTVARGDLRGTRVMIRLPRHGDDTRFWAHL